jgi:iron complex transport system substrate-binding protein
VIHEANWLIFIIGLFLFSGCGSPKEKDFSSSDKVQSEFSNAERFMLEKKDGYTILSIINPWQGAEDINLKYYLVRRGTDLPADISDTSHLIFVPVRNIICMSTTHLAMISALGEENSVSGFSGTDFIYSEKLNKRINDGHIKDIGYENSLNNEMMLKIAPDMVMIYGIGSESGGYIGKIEELGIKVVFNADYLETDPLGKAEWIKVFGALYCRETQADSIFSAEVEAYVNLKNFVSSNIKSKPKVMLGLPYRDTWYVSPGNSYTARFIDDAGGNYIWSETSSSYSMPFGLENVYLQALKADFWLNIGTVKTKAEIAATDKRLTGLRCFKNSNLYNNNLRTTSSGGNDYWEKGALYPHLILKDIAMILHPDLFSNDSLFFYRKIN